MTYLTRTPDLVKPLARDLLAWVKTGRSLHLTFDDGPIPEVTPWVLDRLSEHGAKATFFWWAGMRPTIYDPRPHSCGGHAVGNHTWDRANGWSTTGRAYLHEVFWPVMRWSAPGSSDRHTAASHAGRCRP